jgi:hypothetical protein
MLTTQPRTLIAVVDVDMGRLKLTLQINGRSAEV